MQHHALRKYQGPGVWAHVKADYLAGETAGVVARRYDVSVANLRKRASEEGWTRAAHAQAVDAAPPRLAASAPAPAAPPQAEPPGAPLSEVLAAALARAGRQIAEGRGAEAAATLKAADALRRLHAEIEGEAPAEAEPTFEDEEAAARARFSAMSSQDRADVTLGVAAELEVECDRLVRRLLADSGADGPLIHMPFVLHWRARHLGQEAAAADHATAVARGWAAYAYDADARLLPLAELLAGNRRRLFPRAGDPPDWLAAKDAPPWLEPIVPQVGRASP